MELVRNDISAALFRETNVYDVIYSGFALHHLPLEGKAEFFRRAARCVKRRGFLLLVDVMREEEESLELYYRHYCGWLRDSFTALGADELDLVCDHIVDNDLPEPLSVPGGRRRARQDGANRELQLASLFEFHPKLRLRSFLHVL